MNEGIVPHQEPFWNLQVDVGVDDDDDVGLDEVGFAMGEEREVVVAFVGVL